MRCIIILLLMAGAGGCQNRANSGAGAAGSVAHVVIFYLKDPGNAEARQRVIETSKRFTAIPGVVSVQAGTVLPSTRPVVDSSYDVGVVITFEDQKAMAAYETHPIHREAVNGVLREVVGRIVVYDFVD